MGVEGGGFHLVLLLVLIRPGFPYEEILMYFLFYIFQFTYEAPDPSRSEIVSKTMSLVLCELSQLVVGFTYCYENEMSHWCNKSPPVLNELGPAFKRVYNLLQTFVKVIVRNRFHTTQG